MKEAKLEHFDEEMGVCELNEVREIQSAWGNSYLHITEEEIKALREGKVLHHDDGEYGTFIVLWKGGAE